MVEWRDLAVHLLVWYGHLVNLLLLQRVVLLQLLELFFILVTFCTNLAHLLLKLVLKCFNLLIFHFDNLLFSILKEIGHHFLYISLSFCDLRSHFRVIRRWQILGIFALYKQFRSRHACLKLPRASILILVLHILIILKRIFLLSIFRLLLLRAPASTMDLLALS